MLGDKGMPHITAVQSEMIPQLLKSIDRWVVWRAGPTKASGKFDKFPVDPVSGRAINALDEVNWLSFDRAMHACIQAGGNGVGVVLDHDHPLIVDGQRFILTALDFDHCSDRMNELREVWLRLGQTYLEISPSGNGLRMIGLSREPIRGGNAGDGREMYSHGRFVTITGTSARGTVRDFTDAVMPLEREWFGDRQPRSPLSTGPVVNVTWPENAANVARVQSMIDCISSDLPYDDWRNISWSVMSTGWRCAPVMLHDWSARTPDRYDKAALDDLLSQFDPTRGLTIATLQFHAAQHGYRDNSVAAPKPGPHQLLTIDQLLALPPVRYIVRDLLPERGLAALYGPPGSGKSFLAMDLVLSIALGAEHWFGHRLTQAPVAYVALEGKGGMAPRVKAWLAHSGLPAPTNVRFYTGNLSLLDAGAGTGLARAIVDELGAGAIIVVDTLSRASAGGDENSSVDMTKVIENAELMGELVGGAVILVHHTGKDAAKGPRGHSALLGAVDTSIEVTNAAGGRSWSAKKVKDGEAGQTRYFELASYPVGTDQWDEELRSCAVRPMLGQTSAAVPAPTGGNQKLIMAALRTAAIHWPGGIPWAEALTCAAGALTHLAGRCRSVAKETLEKLLARGNISMNEGLLSFA